MKLGMMDKNFGDLSWKHNFQNSQYLKHSKQKHSS